MKKIAVALVLFLAACNSADAVKVVEMVKQNCGIAVSVVDVASALSAANPTVVGVDAVAHAICSQWAQKTGDSGMFVLVQDQQDTKNCAAVVNGVCIHKKGD